MRATRLPFRLLLPAGLIALVVLLGALQYRWLGQVSEAERAQLGRTLTTRAMEFANEFDREIALASTLLTIDADSLEADPAAGLASRYDAWRERALLPAMVRGLYIARAADAGHALSRWTPDTRRIETVDWPDHFAGVKRAVSAPVPRPLRSTVNTAATAGVTSGAAVATGAGGLHADSLFTMSLSPVVDSVPALIVPIVTRPIQLPAEGDMMVAVRFAGTDFLIVELDRAVVIETLIPTLVERFFPESGSDRYRVAIVDPSSEAIYARGFEGPVPDELHVDASARFFTGNRYEFSARMLTESRLLAWQTDLRRSGGAGGAAGTIVSAPATAAPTTPMLVESLKQVVPMTPSGSVSVFVQERSGTPQTARITLGGWRLLLQHGAGSLDNAVAQARQRNLVTSFGILGVLLAGVGLIIANARKSERLAAQQMEFVATVSHELRTPLAVIRSAGQNLSAGVVDDPEQTRRYGHLIESEGRRLTDMVEEVLEFAGLSGNRRPLALRPVEVGALAREVVESHHDGLTAAGMQVDIDTDDQLPPIMADEDALRRALSNLVANAIKYGADGRWLGVRVARDQADPGWLVLEVADRGAGIAAEDQAHIFEPFYRGRRVVDQQIHGNGLGLSLVARIAEAHGGSVTTSPTPGGGATFLLRMPATDVPVHG